jgi:hypothetical protein
MDQEIRITVSDGRTIVTTEYHIPEIEGIDRLVVVEPLGMTAEKIEEARRNILGLLETPKNIVTLVAFINVNGMSNLIVSQKYAAEVAMLKKLTASSLKQSFLRIYWNLFAEVNSLQHKANCFNFYERKAKKLNIEGDFSEMHFAFDFDGRFIKHKLFKDLKAKIVVRK